MLLFTTRSTAHHSDTSTKQKRLTSGLSLAGLMATLLLITGCSKTPPDYREQVTAPVFEEGDSKRGQMLYEEHCEQCHTLRPGSNKKGPQLVGVYEAPSAILKDYNYSDAMDNANLIWDAETLDRYIAEPDLAVPDTLMLSDPMPNATDRKDIIAYISTLGRDAPPVAEEEK